MHVMILGTRGIPACHGGFETFAQDLSLFLADRNHHVTVYCQAGPDTALAEDVWNGVHRVLVPSPDSSIGTMLFDWAATMHSSRREGTALTLGYNTGVFNLMFRLRHIPNIMNMDGIEWKRAKWSWPQRGWLWFNEWAGARCADHLIADHPEIAVHLRRHTSSDKVSMIPYGADAVTSASTEPLTRYGLKSKGYYFLVARAEPENSILEIVSSFSSRRVSFPLVVLGEYSPERNRYHRRVIDAAGPTVRFAGAIYDREVVQALRFHARAYIHGHQVGGTNPSLVESLAAGNAILAHDNRFNRWVAGQSAKYFKGSDDLEEALYSLEQDPCVLLGMEESSRQRHGKEFTKERVLSAYEELLHRFASGHSQ